MNMVKMSVKSSSPFLDLRGHQRVIPFLLDLFEIYAEFFQLSGPLEVSDVHKEGCKLKWKPPLDDGGTPITGLPNKLKSSWFLFLTI